jgi:spermidine/putrescine transport system substrate-binding protein
MTSGAKVVQRSNLELLGDLLRRYAASLLRGGAWSLALLVAVSCTPFAGNAPTAPVELLLYDWADDIPQHVLDRFTQETGLPVKFVTYESTEEAAATLRTGVSYDVAVIENRFIPALIEEKVLAELDQSLLPNFKNISPNFRGLIYDPENAYTVPYSWGTSGIVVRSDLQTPPIQKWADLWHLGDSRRVAFYRGQPRETIGLTLKSLGFSANSEKPAELQAALEMLLELRPVVEFSEEYDPVTVARALADGVAVAAMGYAFDVSEGAALGVDLDYVLPEEGGLLWGDNFVVPAASAHPAEAQQLIDFLLRPEISATIMNEKVFAMANEAALPFVTPELANNEAVFPPNQQMQHLEIVLPLSSAGEELYAQVWEQFLAASDAPINQP